MIEANAVGRPGAIGQKDAFATLEGSETLRTGEETCLRRKLLILWYWYRGLPHSQAAMQIEESSRFLKKAAQKLGRFWARGGETSTAQIREVFLLLFVHKK